MIKIALAAVLMASSFPLQAQVVAPQAPKQAPEATCDCDHYNFKPLTEKAVAVEAYWKARRKYKIAGTLATTMAIFGLMARDGRAVNEAQNGLSNAASELNAARAKAVSLQGIKIDGEDDKTVEILMKKGVDYTIRP